MASVKLTVSWENKSYESKKQTSSSFNFSSNALFLGCVSSNGAFTAKPLCKLKHSRLKSKFFVTSEYRVHGDPSDNRNEYVVGDDNGDLHFHKGRVNLWKKFRGTKSVNKNPNRSLNVHRNGNGYKKDRKPTVLYEKDTVERTSDGINVLDVDFNGVKPDLSSDRCNVMLDKFEKSNNRKALQFFEWMKVNGKLKKNTTAYNLILRVLGRKKDWDGAETVIKQMVSESDCELNYRTFNALIYVCYKDGLVDLGAKWFRMMLDYKVQPNVATFGMLMALYQKGWAVEEAEYTFSRMRDMKIISQSAYSFMITIYTRMGLHEKAEAIIGFLREDEVVLNNENWFVLLNAYCQQGKLSEAEEVFCAMEEAGVSPNIVAYNMLITGYGRISSMDQAERVFCNLKENGFEPDEATYRSLIEGWGRADNYKQVKHYHVELERLGFKPNSANLKSLIKLQAKNEDEEGAIRTIDDMLMIKCQKPSILGTVLRAYEKAKRLDKLPLVLEGSIYGHVLKNKTSCAILVTSYVKNGLIDHALKVLNDKQWKDPVFEDNLYHLLICSCKDLGHLENAVKIFTSIPKHSKPNLNTHCTMIDIYSKLNLFVEAENLYTDLKTSCVKLDLIAFNVIVRMYVKFGRLKEASLVLDIMDEQHNIVPDVYLLRDMLRIYQRCGPDDKLVALYSKVSKNGEIWDEEMYRCVINCCARVLPVDELSRLFDKMLERGYTPNTTTVNVIIHAYGKAKLFEKVRKVLWMAKKQGLVDVISYNTIIAAYGKNKYLKNMSATVKKMQFDGFTVSLEAYNSMLDAYGKEGEMDKFKSVLQQMKSSKCSLDHYSYNILINIYGEQGWIEEVGGVLMELKECGISPDLCSYNTLIKAYGIAGMVEDAVALVKEMRENGIEPDKITYTNMISALRRNDMFLEAVKWSLWMKQMGL